MRYVKWMSIWVSAILALTVIGTFALARRAFAQSAIASITPDFDRGPSYPNMTIVMLAVTDNLPRSDVDIVIQRRATLKPHDVILIRPRAMRPERLAQAVASLQAVRRSHGRIPTEDMLVTTDEIPGVRPPRVNEAVGWVKSLQSAKAMTLPGVGPVPMIGLHLPDPETAKNP